MSHRATIDLALTDSEALAETCARLGLPVRPGSVTFYDGSTATGTVIQLPGWRYGVVVDARGTLHYDHYLGYWGDLAHLHRFRQTYTELATLRAAARQRLRLVSRQTLDNGWIRLELEA